MESLKMNAQVQNAIQGQANALDQKLSQVKNFAKVADNASRKKIREVAEDFEAVFLTQMVQQMFKDIPIGKFGGGYGEKVWRDQLYDEYGRSIAKSGGVGIADSVEREILRMNGMEATGSRYQTGDSAVIRGRAAQAYAAGMPAGGPNLSEPLPTFAPGTPLSSRSDKS